MNQNKKVIYLLGISGMGMSPLAIYLSQLGYSVSGTDDNMRHEIAELLKSHGVIIDLENKLPENCEVVVYSSAISCENPLFQEALKQNVRLVRRGSFLAEVIKNKNLIAIVGSHGKSTTTAMLIHALKKTQFDFSYLIGALFSETHISPAHYSNTSDWIVTEIDESDGTINDFFPQITLLVNFDWDHPSQYPCAQDLENTFLALFEKTQKAVILPDDCQLVEAAKKNTHYELLSYGKSGNFQATAHIDSNGGTHLLTQGILSKEQINVPNGGLFNAHNALAAVSVMYFLLNKLPRNPFDGFLGVKRRQEYLYESNNLNVIMDYAHHPAEIDALLNYFLSFSKNPNLVVFQPHRYTRTQIYFHEFAQVLSKAEKVILLPVYAASETPLEEGLSEKIVLAFPQPKDKLILIDNPATELFAKLPLKSEVPLNILFIGAGDIETLAYKYKENLKRNDWWQSFCKTIQPGTKVSECEPLASKTTIRLGGSSRFYIEPASLADLTRLISEANVLKCPVFILGRGSNLIVPDEGFDGVVIRLSHSHWKEIRDLGGGRIWAGAGVRLKELCGYACKFGLSGFEFFEGIPGSLGGSLRMNAGAMGGWLFDVIESIKCISQDGSIKEFSKKDLTLGYRFCKNLENAFAIGAVLKSSEIQNQHVIRAKLDEFASKRKISQPREPSAGCIFKNPQNNFAGALIDSVGLKGFSIGGAQVSLIHGNFIINNGNATSTDVVQLIHVIRERVYNHCGIHLEPEVLFLGKTWDKELPPLTKIEILHE